MTLVLGEVQSESFDVGTTGQTFTRTTSLINGVVTVWNPTFTELGGGFYRYAYTPAEAGSYEWVGTATDSTAVAINFDVEATGVTTVVAAIGAQTTTLRELRRRLAERFDDYVPLVATANGTTSTLVDTYHVNSASEHFNGSDLVFTSGANAGQRRRVLNTDVAGSLTCSAPVLPLATAGGDTVDAFNLKGRGFKAEQLDRSLNNAIAAAWPTAAVHLRADIAAGFDASTGEIVLPDAVAEVESLEVQDRSGRWYPVPKANHYGGDGWWSDRAEGELRLYGGRAAAVNAGLLRVFGIGHHPPLVDDADTCAIRPEWLIAFAAYHLAAGAVRNEEHSIRVNIFKDEMERYRTGIITARGPSSSKVRAA